MGTCRCKTSRYSSADGPLLIRYDGPVHRRDSSRRRSLRIFHEVWQQNCSFGKNGKRRGCVSALESGAGDGNRTHVRSLGSSRSATELRPLVVSDCTQELIFRTPLPCISLHYSCLLRLICLNVFKRCQLHKPCDLPSRNNHFGLALRANILWDRF